MTLENLFEKEEAIQIPNLVQDQLNGKIVLITGAAGSIGSEFSKVLAVESNCELVLLDQAESPLFNLQQELIELNRSKCNFVIGDICDQETMELLFIKYQPDIVYHVAAYKHVSLMEEHPFQAFKVNIIGTSVIANLSKKYEVEHFVLVSTDKAVNPKGIMGATKRVSELYVNSLNEKEKNVFKIVRFGNVPYSNGSVIPLFKKQLLIGGPLTVTDKKVSRYFIKMNKAIELMLSALIIKEGNLFIFDMGLPIKIYDIALQLVKNSGFNYPDDIAIVCKGLRRGEKLHEELVYKNEKLIGDKKSGIKKYMLNINDVQKVDLNKLIFQKQLISEIEIIRRIKKIVPEYISNNSEYQVLDK